MKYPLPKLCCVLILLTLFSCNSNPQPNSDSVNPAPIGFDEDELSERRKKWIELIHTAPPGVDWRAIEAVNVENNIRLRNARKAAAQRTTMVQETFANGNLSGTWSERGPQNQAGSIIAADYDSANNELYVISAGGSLWKNAGLAANNWTVLNDDYIFDNSLLKAFKKNGGGVRLLVQVNNQLKYSDNSGAGFTNSNVPYPVGWGGNRVISAHIQRTNSNNMYLLCSIWDNVSWSPRLALYRSTDEGVNFTKFYVFSHSSSENVKLTIPYNSGSVYIFDCGSNPANIKITQLSGTTLTDLNNIAKPEALSGNIQFSATLVAGTMHMYFMNNNIRIFTSTNYGASWTYKGALPQNAWDRLDVSNTDGLKVYSGGVEAMRSFTGGASWTVVNGWGDYYGNIAGKLHADIMNIVHFRKNDGTPFMIVNNHGGVAISYDNLVTTNNLTITGLHSAQFYDILTAPDNTNYLYAGSQDQGLQKNTIALTSGLLNFNQTFSGDFGYLTLADNNRTFYCQYPGGALFMWRHPSGNYLTTWTIPGTTKPNYGWMLPMKNVSNPLSDTVLMAGGNLNGGTGSYLCRISTLFASPYTVSASQYNYDFRANSRTTTAGLTAIEVSKEFPEKIYTATEDGSFFYSNNNGSSWNKSTTFSVGGGWYLYGSTILASELTPGLVWYGGSGYGGSSMFKSTNGGQTFSPMTNGLPQTLIYEVVANLTESMLFAATEAGPYVYIVSENMWYPMIGASTPVQSYVSVEYISSSNTVRFATFGRGVYDFAITEPNVYYFNGNGNWNNSANWLNQLMPPATLTGKHEVFINPPASGECVLNINQTINAGAKFRVARNKKFRITGGLSLQ